MGDGILLSFDEAIALVGRRGATARLIAIDGLPLSGKSTLAERMAAAHGLAILPFDDFVLPRHMRPKGIAPGYPFPYFRTDAFRRAVRDLLAHGACTYLPFNWKTGRLQGEPTTLRADGPVIVEGCSTLDPELATHYDLRLFLESDRPSLLAARAIRKDDSRDAFHKYDAQHIAAFTIPLVLFAVGGVLLACSLPAGLVVVAAGTIVALVGAALFSWIALVEILR